MYFLMEPFIQEFCPVAVTALMQKAKKMMTIRINILHF